MTPIFSISVRVYYEDTDAGGVVYYANYLKFMERARTEWLRGLGFEQDELSRTEGVIFAVRAAQVEYLKPARFNDALEVTVELARRGAASINFKQEVR
ncbi:MAG: YbgC/FadM family acyl-CoA thioesterase, partial [Gammaproteobacteria bacterium]|nr:YbgC/FadM family acyl-CoA thioesterase [Gammaproteobacteria bacterium]